MLDGPAKASSLDISAMPLRREGYTPATKVA
jgi:hypothetical protein